MQLNLHGPSALLGAGILALAFFAGSSSPQLQKVAQLTFPTDVRVVGVPDPHTAVVIPESSPYVVPGGRLLVVTGLGRTSSSGTDVSVVFDGTPMWFGSLTSNAQTTHDVPAGLVAKAGTTVSAGGTASVVLGYLVKS